MKNLIVFVLLLSLIGCSFGIAERRQLMKENYPSYPDTIKRAIDNHHVIEGMTEEQVFVAIGSTPCISSNIYKGKKTIVWSYQKNVLNDKPLVGTWNCNLAIKRVYFEDGIVVGWDDIQ